MRRGGQSESDLAIRRWLLSGRRGEKLHGKRLEIATKPVQSRFSFDGLNRGGYFEIYIYIYFCQRRLRLDLGPLCRWPIRDELGTTGEGRLKNCARKRERERDTVWRVIDCAAWLQRVTHCRTFFSRFFLFSRLEVWKRGGKRHDSPCEKFSFRFLIFNLYYIYILSYF